MIAAILLVIAAIFTNTFIVFYLYRREKQRLIDKINEFIVPAKQGEPSPLGLYINQIAEIFVHKAMGSIKGTANQVASVEKRYMNQLEQAATQDLIAQENPIMGALSQLPAVQKLIKKNPQLLQMALSAFSGQKGGAAQGNNDNGHIEQPKFDL